MSAETINIYDQYPIIDEHVQLPDNIEGNRTKVKATDYVEENPSTRVIVNIDKKQSVVRVLRTE